MPFCFTMFQTLNQSKGIDYCPHQARSQDLEKGGGGYFERVRSLQTTLIRIFIDLESVSHGLSGNWYGISRKARKFNCFFRPKSGGLQKKKGLHQFWDWFFGRNPKFKGFFCPKSGGLQKKRRSSPILRLIFPPKSEIQTFEGGLFSYGGGGYFQFFTKKSA